MLVLHHCSDARSFRPLWILEEMELPYELRMLPFPPCAAVPDYLARSPLGTIPLLKDGDIRMTESAAICQYLVSRYGPSPLDVAPEEPGYAAFLNGLHFGEATLTFPRTLVLRHGRLEPRERRLPQVAEDYGRWFLSRPRKGLGTLGGGFYAASRFTVADVSIGYALLLAGKLGLDAQFTPEAAGFDFQTDLATGRPRRRSERRWRHKTCSDALRRKAGSVASHPATADLSRIS